MVLANEIKKGMVLEIMLEKATVKSVLNRKGKTYIKTVEGISMKCDSNVYVNLWR